MNYTINTTTANFKMAIRPMTLKNAKELLGILENNGYTWAGRKPLSGATNWHGEQTIYFIYPGQRLVLYDISDEISYARFKKDFLIPDAPATDKL